MSTENIEKKLLNPDLPEPGLSCPTLFLSPSLSFDVYLSGNENHSFIHILHRTHCTVVHALWLRTHIVWRCVTLLYQHCRCLHILFVWRMAGDKITSRRRRRLRFDSHTRTHINSFRLFAFQNLIFAIYVFFPLVRQAIVGTPNSRNNFFLQQKMYSKRKVNWKWNWQCTVVHAKDSMGNIDSSETQSQRQEWEEEA